MNSISSLNVILLKIQENAHVFENSEHFKHVASVICKLGNLVMKKSLSCSLLKNVVTALSQLHKSYEINSDEYKKFLYDLNKFYKSHDFCDIYKLDILLCFSSAVEIEFVSLLKLCTTISTVNELDIIKSAVENSILLQACQKSRKHTQKVMCILKKAFILSEGNPIVGYLAFYLCKSIERSINNSYVLSKNLNFLDTIFDFPYHFLKTDDQELYIKQLIKLCIEYTKMNLCTDKDVIFYTAIYPLCYHKMLELGVKQTCLVLEFLKLLCKDHYDFSDWIDHIKLAHENCIWKFLIQK